MVYFWLDGVSFAHSAWCKPGTNLTFTVTVGGNPGVTGGKLGAWFDLNQNGMWDWDSGERFIHAVTRGENTVTVPCPVTWDYDKPLNARFRLYRAGTSDSDIKSRRWVNDGEVEDYSWSFTPTAVSMVELSGETGAGSLIALAPVAIAAVTALGCGESRKRRRLD